MMQVSLQGQGEEDRGEEEKAVAAQLSSIWACIRVAVVHLLTLQHYIFA